MTAPAGILDVPKNAGYRDGDGRARVIGYNDMDEMLGALGDRFSELQPSIRFAFELPATRAAPPALIAGTSAFAPMGAALTPEDRAEFRQRWGHEPVAIRVAHASLKPGALTSPLGVLVHRSNPLRFISMHQVRRVFLAPAQGGSLRLWGDLGLAGPWRGQPLKPIGLAETTALGRYLLDGPLRGTRFASDYARYPQSREVAAAVAADPLAIGIANLSNVGPQTRALGIIDDHGRRVHPTEAAVRSGSYPFDRHLLVYARRDASGSVEPVARAFLTFALSGEGQAIVAAGTRGYQPLNAREIAQERRKLTGPNDPTGTPQGP